MELKLLETYKNYDIFQDIKTGDYVVYNDDDPILSKKVTRNTIRLFVKNSIDINMNMISYSTVKQISQIDIDVKEILNRDNIKTF